MHWKNWYTMDFEAVKKLLEAKGYNVSLKQDGKDIYLSVGTAAEGKTITTSKSMAARMAVKLANELAKAQQRRDAKPPNTYEDEPFNKKDL